ncbi:MAG: dihydroneopterin aldolase [Gammaproteobacteria bacterium]|nr:dihydroneopterin aldolase [Gammaproteobacteria bacterium]
MSQTEQLEDWIEIHDLKVKTRIGVHAWEQQIDQTLSLDIRFPLTLGDATLTLSQTVDYDALCKAVIAFVSTQAFELIETVAQQVAQLILSEFKVKQVQVAVSKPWAVEQAGRVTVRVTR